MSKNVVVLRGGIVEKVFSGSEEFWSDAHREMFNGCTFVFSDENPIPGNVYNEELNQFENGEVYIQQEEELVTE